MIKTIAIYALSVGIVLAGYFGYDYGVANTKEKMQSAADKLTNNSVKEADKLEAKEEKLKIVYRDVIKTVEIAKDEKGCLDASPGDAIVGELRKLQSR